MRGVLEEDPNIIALNLCCCNCGGISSNFRGELYMNRTIRQWLCALACAILAFCPTVGHATAPQRILTVDPNAPPSPTTFSKIQEAIDVFQGSNALYTQINIAPGTYVENIQLEQTSAAANYQTRNYSLGEVVATADLGRGLQINGDMRPVFPQYQNGYRHAANSSKTQLYSLETSVPGVGPFPVLVSNSFGTQPAVDTGPYPAEVTTPLRPSSDCPLTNDLTGNFAVMERGLAPGCSGSAGFAFKTKQAQDAGALAVIIIDNSPTGIISMGGSDPTITIPAFSMGSVLGAQLLTAIANNPGMTITVKPPLTFYNPSIGTNYAMVTLSHPGGDYSKIQVTMSSPPAVDPNLARGTTPVLEQPVFEDPRLDFHPGDKIILSESDIFGSGGRTVFEIASLNGNVITLTEAVDPSDVDITKPGSSLSFLPNVLIVPAVGRKPIFSAQSVGFSATGLWFDTGPLVAFGQTTYAFTLGGSQASLANIIVTDTLNRSANGAAFAFFSESSVSITDGWRASGQNRRLSSIGWASGFLIENMSRFGGGIVFATNAKNNYLFRVSQNSYASVDNLILMGNYGLYQSGSNGLVVDGDSYLGSASQLTVTDVFGSGIIVDDATVSCDSFSLERCYKPSAGTIASNAMQLLGNSQFTVYAANLYADNGEPTQSINTTSVVKDCYDVDPNADITSGTLPNVGIYVTDQAKFLTRKDLYFSGNDINYLTAIDGQFITPGWSETPGSTLPVYTSGKLNSVYQLQELKGNRIHLTLDPAEEFLYQGLYISDNTVGKTFTIFSDSPTKHCITLTNGSFVGTNKKSLRFHPYKGAYVTLKILSPTEVLVLESRGVSFHQPKHCAAHCKNGAQDEVQNKKAKV